jgi:glycosyltransferase involved in cell wall biosynthesis
MTVEAFILNWNEELLHLTIKHYQEFCDKITILDNYSTDGSDKVAEAMGCHVVKFGQPGVLSDAAYRKLKNTCWKGSQADWVIVCDADEILYHKDLKRILTDEKERGTTIFKTSGFNIYSEEIPKESYIEIRTGQPSESYSKRIIFNPGRIKDMWYEYGAHTCKPQGSVVESQETLFLLHYRNLGGIQRLIDRHAAYRTRLSPDNKRFGLGVHYTYEDERRVREWHEYYANCKELSELGILF